MDFSTLKDQLTDQLKESWDRIRESSLYVELNEKFEVLPSRIQKIIIISASVLFGLFLFSIPYSSLEESWTYEEGFLDNRDLIRELLRASSTLKQASPLPTSSSTNILQSRVKDVLQEARLTTEQIGPIQPILGAKTKLASAAVNQDALSIQLKNLNLRQITDIAYRFQNLGPGIQPITLQIQRASGQTHYYDMIVKIFQFSLNISSDEGASGTKGRPQRGR